MTQPTTGSNPVGGSPLPTLRQVEAERLFGGVDEVRLDRQHDTTITSPAEQAEAAGEAVAA